MIKDNVLVIDCFRKIFTDKSTISQAVIDGKSICYFLEDKDRGLTSDMSADQIKELKVYGETAIPYGVYEIQITYSPRFKKELPVLINVPGYEGIRIHTGNKADDSHGCLLPCMTISLDYGAQSTIAYNKVFGIIKEALNAGKKVFINIQKV